MVDKKDRKDYEEGVRDRQKGAIGQAIIDISRNNPGNPAYYKGRSGKQLDADKKKGK